jgi:3-hydroxy-3-methylglutaryl CoA synthase
VPGERAVANADEDSLTMAVAAGLDCLAGIDQSTIDGLFFATTTAPYSEKQSAGVIAAALDLRHDISTADFTGSLRAATTALRAAADAIDSGNAQSILVTAADCRPGEP